MDLTGRTALVTGAAAGIGRGIAIELARGGANVAVTDLRKEPKLVEEQERGETTEVIEDFGGDALFSECDVGNESSVKATVGETVEAFGGIDILVNNAGISVPGSVTELGWEDWEQIVDVNLTSVYLTTKHAASHLNESGAGRIVNLASTAAFEGTPKGAGYCATKGGVVNLTRQLAVDFGSDGTTANALCPGPIYTSMSQGTFDDPERREVYEEHVLLPYFGEPEDVGQLTRFLASDAARYITGTAIPIDGGWLASR
ncbi:SDR family NAD(P)-dependent oxidoreductase [Natronosalvus rutilus]|uniref:SDR family oxidoreductase n=1 Tax=Natronosalvus rutilus TaxID=2953753 RepID=A0A9E7NC12_9EURY|nr:SDR family NAD(P)-dependent oxidoreductase [Natronosalvus rutilus]UTF55679.1 SDR family oxidoreductase [Natronosalvus rutilus]